MKKHICILFCFNNVDHIIQCYESLQNNNTDFFVIENKSDYSDQISTYFKKQPLVGYIQFKTNITNNAIPIFLTDFKDLLERYDYITITDCDLYVENSTNTFNEIFKNLDLPGVGISCVDLSMVNFPEHVPGSNEWFPSPVNITDEYIECATGVHLMTTKRELLEIFYNTVPFIDCNLVETVYHMNYKWVKTIQSKAIHLTWDLYTDTNWYYNFKIKNKNIWNHSNQCDYIKLI